MRVKMRKNSMNFTEIRDLGGCLSGLVRVKGEC